MLLRVDRNIDLAKEIIEVDKNFKEHFNLTIDYFIQLFETESFVNTVLLKWVALINKITLA